jgi:molybdopterin molybdotransferase
MMNQELSAEAALARILAKTPVVQETQLVPLVQARGRVLAKDVVAPINVPSFALSAMDGYAINLPVAGDLAPPITFPIIGKSLAGKPFTEFIGEGQAVRIMTGAAIPEGANTVIAQEDTTEDNGQVIINTAKKILQNQNIRSAGENIPQNTTVINAGKRLSVNDLGVLASLGIAQVQVYRPLRVGIFSTGDELMPLGEALPTACIYDSNRMMIRAILEEIGVEVSDLGIVHDDEGALHSALINASHSSDMVITSGGVSVGEADFIRTVVQKVGDIEFWRLAIRPGRPLAFGQLARNTMSDEKNNDARLRPLFFGLPGNPLATTICLGQFVVPAIKKMMGERINTALPIFHARSQSTYYKRAGRQEYLCGVATVDDHSNEWQVSFNANKTAQSLYALSTANCLVILPAEEINILVGTQISVQWLT